MDEQTESPWEDINPRRTALVSQPEPQSQSLDPWSNPRTALAPATSDDFRRELTSCLALCGAVGMTEESRREWLTVAWGTLQGIPADLLARGCAEARRTADHPSKIVPTIMREVEQAWRWRREYHGGSTRIEPTRRIPEPERCTPEQARAILKEFGLSSAFRA